MHKVPAAACAVLLGAPALMAETFTTAEVVKRSVAPECLDWKIVGICLWLHCKRGRCRVNTTPRVHHYLPDLVFLSYDHTGQPPWLEWRATAHASTLTDSWLQGGSFPRQESQDTHSLRFKEVDVVGHPIPVRGRIAGVGYLCRSQAKPLFPYFLSKADALQWRGGGKESLRVEAFTPGMREIGTWPLNSWGAIFPRIGLVVQPEDAKAAAVTVQRAADIVTQLEQGRVYVPFAYDGHREVVHGDISAPDQSACETSGGQWQGRSWREGRCHTQRQMAWLPPISERNARWQMISPTSQSSCETFGAASNWSSGKTSADGNYAWNLWRPYECCAPGKGKFLGYRNF